MSMAGNPTPIEGAAFAPVSGKDAPRSAPGASAPTGKSGDPVGDAFRSLRGCFTGVAVVSAVINLLMLTGPIFMLQIYDRVLASGSVPTLVTLSGLVLALFGFMALLDGLRSRIFTRISQDVDNRLSGLAFRTSTFLPVRFGAKGAAIRPVQDLDNVRAFLAGSGPAAIFDMPWLPFYLGIVFLFATLLGYVALAGAAIIFTLIIINELIARKAVKSAMQTAGRRTSSIEESRRNAEAIQAMGMSDALTARWTDSNTDYLDKQRHAADWSSLFSTMIKSTRMVLQSAMLAVGAWLVIQQEISAGVMIAASIMTARALAPVEAAIGNWPVFVTARRSLGQLRKILRENEGAPGLIPLPLPSKSLKLDRFTCGPDGQAVVKAATFDLEAGDALAVVGPSGSGKSTLVRGIAGAIPRMSGDVRFDGAELEQWADDRIGAFIGYLPQDIQLFDGTVAANIARFDGEADPAAVVEAARLAGVHDLIVGLPDGYNTVIGSAGYSLSGGQRQRIALARALFGDPFVVILDEPNSNLDANGEAALTEAIKALREKGSIVIIVSHRPSAMAVSNKVLCLRDGQVAAFGPRQKFVRPVEAVKEAGE